MIKGSIPQDDTIILNVYVFNLRVSKQIRQKLIDLKGEIYKSTIVVGDFNTPLLVTDRPSRQKSVRIFDLNNISTNLTHMRFIGHYIQ